MFEIEKAFDTLQLVAAGSKKIAETPLSPVIEKADGQLHAVKRLVRPKDGGKPYYRTYWLADHNEAYSGRHAVNSLTSAQKEVERKKKEYDRQPDYDWRKEDYDKAKAQHEKIQAQVDALETKAVKIEDRKPSVKTGTPVYQSKMERLAAIEAEKEVVLKEWKAWGEGGPKKVREQASADYQKMWADAGLTAQNQRDFSLTVNDSEGKELMTIGHDMSWHIKDAQPVFEMRMRHSSFKTSDPEDFKKFGELTEAMAKVHAVTGDPEKMAKMAALRKTFQEADNQANYKNEYSDKVDALDKERRALEAEVKADKIADVMGELGNEPFELSEDYRTGEGRRGSNYRFAKVIKQTPKQVVVGFSDSAAEGSFYQTKTMSTGDFHKFVEGHVDLDAHLPDYQNEVKGVKVEADEHKDTADKLGVAPEKLGKLINDDHKKEASMSGWDKKDVEAYRDKMADKIKEYKDEASRGNTLSEEQKKDMNLSIKRLGEANTELANRKNRNDAPAPEKHTMDPENNKKVNNYDTYDHPSGGKISKGDKVTFDHKGVQKEATVSGVNVYQRFANPYVKMKGTDGKTYEIVISKVNPQSMGK